MGRDIGPAAGMQTSVEAAVVQRPSRSKPSDFQSSALPPVSICWNEIETILTAVAGTEVSLGHQVAHGQAGAEAAGAVQHGNPPYLQVFLR